jgi:pyruvate dehydrogenase E2 component (dihydrolipoamide acetyltransferase)
VHSEFRMPSLGPDMESGTLVAWQVKPGDTVKRGDIVAAVETDKGVVDVEIFAAGTVEKLLVEAGAHVPVGTLLAELSSEGEPSGGTIDAAAPPPSRPIVPTRTQPTIAQPPQAATQRRQRVSPAARAKAHASGIDLMNIVGTGPGGVVTLDDLGKQAAGAPAAALRRASDMRQIIAKAMSRSKREIPHYYLSLTCCFAPARDWLDRHNAAVPIEQRLLPAALFVKAVALAARASPDFNGVYGDDAFVPAAAVNVGMAIAMRGGRLVAPAILDATQKPLPTIMSELRDLTTRVRAGHMRASELASSTITVTSLAEEGVETIMPVIYPPQVAIVGIGSVVERPWIVGGAVLAAPVVTLTLAADHRVSDGRAGARFLRSIHDHLQEPGQL